MVACNGVPVRHCVPIRRDLAERYATDPGYRLSLIPTKLYDKCSFANPTIFAKVALEGLVHFRSADRSSVSIVSA